MNREVKIEGPKTYATADNARAAVAKKNLGGHLHFIMRGDDGRFFPVFIGQSAIHAGIHFHFNVVG